MESGYEHEEIDGGKWRSKANCIDKGIDNFFVEGRGFSHEYLAARIICYRCQVQKECLDYAVLNSHKDGMWGGLTYRQRLAYRRGERGHALTREDIFKSAHGHDSPEVVKKLSDELSMTPEEVKVFLRAQNSKMRKENARKNRIRFAKEAKQNG